MRQKEKVFKSKEDIISMFLGLGVVIALVFLVVNFIERRKGNIDIPGVINDIKIEETKSQNEEKVKTDKVTVESGDNLWKIAEKVYGDGYKWVEIAKVNSLKNPGLIYQGQELQLPSEIQKSQIETDGKGQDKEYTVLKGDNMWKIAIKFYNDGYKWTEIWKLNKNRLRDPGALEIGMKLLLW